MPSLRHLRAHGPILVLDAASTRVQVGLLRPGGDDRWTFHDEEAGTGVFRGVEEMGGDLSAITTFVFCEGPGSILGIRTVAMALRTWNVLQPRPIFTYCSLTLVASALGRPDVGVIADVRRDSWHHLHLANPLRRVPTAELNGPLVMPEHFKNWTPLPAGVERTPYDVPGLLAQCGDADLFHAVEAPDAFLAEEPNYVQWTPQIHRAP